MDLFDVFDEQPNGSSGGNTTTPSQTKKRLANGEVKVAPDNNASTGAVNENEPANGSKRLKRESSEEAKEVEGEEDDEGSAEMVAERARRQAEPAPTMADNFEAKQSREIAGDAGLQAQRESDNLLVTSQIRHQVALPPGYDYVPLDQHVPPPEPAHTWPFKLDAFQDFAIKSIQRNESVLVSAHTSAGKTVVAEYAIAQCLKNNQRVIYTSPIKALSNQKYRDFENLFTDVGLMTGDTTLNPTATCLVMTTEILRSMLYKGSEIMREVGWVIFDEVHYLRDPIRGVVWEETIILLPDKVRYVFLSATIPNAYQFAEWISKTHNQPCHVVYTDYRPTPLQHYLFPAGGDGIHLVVDEKGAFREENFSKAMAAIADRKGDNPADPMAKRKGGGKDRRFNRGGSKNNADTSRIVRMVMQKRFNPVIVFSFAKRECEAYALQLAQHSFNDDTEKELVSKIFNGAMEMLSEENRDLPQIKNILPLLRRGIGIHHSGLLPILKEVIEILFQENLLKVLFATETFSIGLNMPAKTVVFTSVRKFDGHTQRWVSPSEFIQMSGRAGRRGKDERGIVIMMIDERMEPATAKEIVRGEQDKLNSSFHLGYNMILNLLRVEGVFPEHMLEHCFYQFQNTASVSGLEKQLHDAEAEKAGIHIEKEHLVKEYFDIRRQLENFSQDIHDTVTHPNYCLHYLQEGRLLHVKWNGCDFGWGIVIRFYKRDARRTAKGAKPQETWIVDVALNIDPDSDRKNNGTDMPVLPPSKGGKSKMTIIPLVLSAIEGIGQVRVFLPDNIRDPSAMRMLERTMEEVLNKTRSRGGPDLMDPIKDMKITDDKFKKTMTKIEALKTRMQQSPLAELPHLSRLLDQYARKADVQNNVKTLKKQINSALAVMHLDELKNRKRVLRRLGFINDAEVVQLKARVACEISTGDELVLSELLFNRFFNEMSPEQCAACLSCFICEGPADDKLQLPESLAKPFKEIQEQARRVAKVTQDSRMPINQDEYVKSFKPQLMEVVFAWTKGESFMKVCKMTDVFEGNLIRIFRRLEELLHQVAQAARVMGSEELENKFEEALKGLCRDIVSAKSLYL